MNLRNIIFIYIFIIILKKKYKLLFDIISKNGITYIVNPPYRLGDMVTSYILRYLPGGKYAHFSKYPKSIASEYIKKTNEKNNWKVLFKILKTKKTNEIPRVNDLVIHLRLGDVMDFDSDSFNKIINNGNKYIFPKQYYKNILKKIRKYNIKRIILVTYFINSKKNTRSKEYLKILENLIIKNNFILVKRTDKTPDDDFIFMSNSHYFCPGKGGFTTIIKNMVLLNNKKIIN